MERHKNYMVLHTNKNITSLQIGESFIVPLISCMYLYELTQGRMAVVRTRGSRMGITWVAKWVLEDRGDRLWGWGWGMGVVEWGIGGKGWGREWQKHWVKCS